MSSQVISSGHYVKLQANLRNGCSDIDPMNPNGSLSVIFVGMPLCRRVVHMKNGEKQKNSILHISRTTWIIGGQERIVYRWRRSQG